MFALLKVRKIISKGISTLVLATKRIFKKSTFFQLVLEQKTWSGRYGY